jgi:titin
VAPSGLVFNAGTLSWTDNSLSETAFVIQKSQDGGISWVEVGRIDRVITDPNTTGGTESFTDASWAMGDQYRVVAQNTVGDTFNYADPNLNEIVNGGFPTITTSAVSDVLDSTPPPAPPSPPPSGLTATAEPGPQVSLAWADNSLDETGYLVQRSTDGVNFTDLTTLPADSVSYVDLAVVAGGTYTYQVAAFNAGGPSAFSNTASASIPGPQGPVAPDALEAVVDADIPVIQLQWSDNSTDETGFLIQRSTDGVNFSDLATVVADVAAYDDLAVFGGFTYTYRVAAFNANGTSAYSNTAIGIMPPDATPPAAPSNLSVTNLTQTTLTLNWTDNSNNELGFTIQRATNSSFTQGLATFNVGAGLTSYNDSGLRRNRTYFYRVLAFNGFNGGAGPFPWSPTLNVTTLK